MPRYKTVRSGEDRSLHVIYYDGQFETLPYRIRSLGPWQGLSEGDIDRLKLHYRLQLAEQGFCVVHQHLTKFSAERRSGERDEL